MGIKGESADQVGRGGVAESIDAWKKGQAAQGIIDRTIIDRGNSSGRVIVCRREVDLGGV